MGDILGDIGDKKRDIGDSMGDRRETGRNFGRPDFWRNHILAGWQARFQTDVWILVGLQFDLPLNYLSLIRPSWQD